MTMMFISVFCKICELNTEREIVFVLISVDSQGVISGSQMCLQLLQNTEIIKQTDVLLSEENMDRSRIYSAVPVGKI